MTATEPGVTPMLRIFHPSDFTPASELAFAHALKLALEAKADLEIMHVARHLGGPSSEVYWSEFPAVRATLARWGVLPENATRQQLLKFGMDVKKIVLSGADPVASILEYCRDHRPDLLVLATHQRDGLTRWLRREVAEPLARRSRAMTLFLPYEGRGFVSPETGDVTLRRILVPVAAEPSAQKAVREVSFLAAGLARDPVDFRLLHVGDGPMPRLQLPARERWNWEERVVRGDAVDQILHQEHHWVPDLVALTTEGHLDFLDALRGSTTERVVRGAHCPVLAVPA
jgi:nucleotide-binding universal stress UspA family protein